MTVVTVEEGIYTPVPRPCALSSRGELTHFTAVVVPTDDGEQVIEPDKKTEGEESEQETRSDVQAEGIFIDDICIYLSFEQYLVAGRGDP